MSGKVEINLPILLPDVPDAKDHCVGRLVEDLEAREGVETSHVKEAPDGEPARLCVHYDPDVVGLQTVRRVAGRVGAHLTDRFGHVIWETDGIDHPRRARTITGKLGRLEGVIWAEATVLGLGIGPAVLAHEGSTLIVVFNALKLLGFSDESE